MAVHKINAEALAPVYTLECYSIWYTGLCTT